MQTFEEYRNEHRTKHTRGSPDNGQGYIVVPMAAEIMKRWQGRIEARGLHHQGINGAHAYLEDYGHGIAAPKCIALALMAETKGCGQMALGFWARAYELETGCYPKLETGAPTPKPLTYDKPATPLTAPVEMDQAEVTARTQPPTITPGDLQDLRTVPTVAGIPAYLQPGQLVTMQPKDALLAADSYLQNNRYGAQGKVDGNRLLAWGCELPIGQTRSMRVKALDHRLAGPLADLAARIGPFILDGEMTYLDFEGGEHRTGAQAATTNILKGHPDIPGQPCYFIFKALFYDGQDLTAPQVPEIRRLDAGRAIYLQLADSPLIALLPLARTRQEKADLYIKQKSEGREGLVFMDLACQYTPGKLSGKAEPFVRSKFVKTLDVFVTKILPCKDTTRAVGALVVSAYNADGQMVELGGVGTGFTREEGAQIAAAFEMHGQVVIEIGTQGFTEGGRVWHARFFNMRFDKSPAQCVL